MGKKIIESVTIENAALYNRIYDSSSVTIELYSWYDEYGVSVEIPDKWWDNEFTTIEKAMEYFNNEVEYYKRQAEFYSQFN